MLSETEIEKRFPVWDALSDLFLDTELDESSHKHIARVILESGFTPEEIHQILWHEVFPSVGDNLRSVAGEWAGFNPEWLKSRILFVISQDAPPMSPEGIISVKELIEITQQEWLKVCGHLPTDYYEKLLDESKIFPATILNTPRGSRVTTDVTVINASRKTSTTIIIFSMIFVGLGVWLLSQDSQTIELPNFGFTLLHIAGGISVLFFGLCAISGFWRLLSKKQALELNGNGITIFTAGPSVLIPWREIEGFSVFRLNNQSFLVINLYNPESHIATGRKFRQRLSQVSYDICGSPFSISANSTNLNILDLSDLCEKYLSRYGSKPNATLNLHLSADKIEKSK